jgi:formate C-acetyltransferase
MGTDAMIAKAKECMDKLNFCEKGAVDKFRYYQAVIMSLEAANTLADRYAELADKMAAEEKDPKRKAELEQIAATCHAIPRKPATTFREALQCFWFNFLMLSPSTTLPGGRFDQFMYPYYKKDLEEGRITEEEAIELLCCLRLKDMELNRTSGKNNRKKNAGMAKWHNFTIGGVDRDGNDATNDITYLVLEAAKITKTPHHTITVRVHKGTPEKLLIKALEVVRMGMGLPAFIGDESYIKCFTSRGLPIEDARNYCMTGCLDANVPGMSRTGPVPMITIPLIFDIFRHRGMDVKTGVKAGIDVGDFTSFKTYDELYAAFRKELDYIMRLVGEKNNVELKITQELLPDPLRSAMMYKGIESGEDTFCRTMPFENGAVVNPIGMVNVGDSLAAIKKLVFDEQKYTLKELNDALEANWEGYEEMRREFEAAPKFGNNDDYVDMIVAECYKAFCDIADDIPTILGGKTIPTGISITSHQPGGGLTGATPDGRKAGEILADGTMSPMHGCDHCGPTAVFNSAMKIDQDPFQATLLNMKFGPSTLKTESDLTKLASMIKTYLTNGGKHVQFNVVDKETLVAAKEDPKAHRDLIVRIAGYSAYFVQLNDQMQDEVIARTEQTL